MRKRDGARAAEAGPPDPLAAAAADLLAAGASVAAVVEATGVGARRLHRHSLDAFGYGPKTLGRILRLQRALDLVRRGVPYAETAALAGYADQAHLSREMRALAGITLTSYAAAYVAGADSAAGSAGSAGAAGANRETPQPSGSSTTA
ncbi:helix-turn-helix domain-containing protein [Streptomyces bambusae]|uniref:Helix-turn-helix domain-containing protein n=1 Tax=Streptomyces bambusae TaxID=1550616 RepID=A0ABS6ZJE1_9ACTN|nr:helix-turn-helix domain-containing protein [Streptomyces bambusae]